MYICIKNAQKFIVVLNTIHTIFGRIEEEKNYRAQTHSNFIKKQNSVILF